MAEKRDAPPAWWDDSGKVDESNTAQAPSFDELTKPELAAPGMRSLDDVTDPEAIAPMHQIDEKTVPVDISAFSTAKPPPKVVVPRSAEPQPAPAPWLPKPVAPPPVASAPESQRSPARAAPAPPSGQARPRLSVGPLSKLSDDQLQFGLIVIAVLAGVLALAIIIGIVVSLAG